jgi:hypothetical protein
MDVFSNEGGSGSDSDGPVINRKRLKRPASPPAESPSKRSKPATTARSKSFPGGFLFSQSDSESQQSEDDGGVEGALKELMATLDDEVADESVPKRNKPAKRLLHRKHVELSDSEPEDNDPEMPSGSSSVGKKSKSRTEQAPSSAAKPRKRRADTQSRAMLETAAERAAFQTQLNSLREAHGDVAAAAKEAVDRQCRDGWHVARAFLPVGRAVAVGPRGYQDLDVGPGSVEGTLAAVLLVKDPVVGEDPHDAERGGAQHKTFVSLQLLRADDDSGWAVWSRSGRVGTDGRGKLEEYSNSLRGEAWGHFCRLFRSKTGRGFEEVVLGLYKARPGKFRVSQQSSSGTAPPPKRPTALPTALTALVGPTLDRASCVETLRHFHVDAHRLDLASLDLDSAYSALFAVESALTAEDAPAVEEAARAFYSSIPRDFGAEAPPAFKEPSDIFRELRMLQVVRYLTVHGSPPSEPVSYESLGCVISPVSSEAVREAVETALGGAAVESMAQVNRLTEHSAFGPFRSLPNRRMLWHCVLPCEAPGLLAGGFQVPPLGAPLGKDEFGRALRVFPLAADAIADSLEPTQGLRPTVVTLFLCEVACGREHALADPRYLRAPPAPATSVVGITATWANPQKDVEWPEGPSPRPVAHLGEAVAAEEGGAFAVPREGRWMDLVHDSEDDTVHTGLLERSVVSVFDSAQVRVRYVVLVRI